MEEVIKHRRGFSVMDPEAVRRIGSKGGKRAHELGKAHRFTPEEARAAWMKSRVSRAANLKAQAEGNS